MQINEPTCTPSLHGDATEVGRVKKGEERLGIYQLGSNQEYMNKSTTVTVVARMNSSCIQCMQQRPQNYHVDET